MLTEKLYYQDPYARTFTARVLSSEPAGDRFGITLDRTIFYPEGGGQPADHGRLHTANVLDVHERDGVIVHLCDTPLCVGTVVEGEIDWARRFDHMQQHSGEHICSGMICERFHCDNVGFHLGAELVTIDFNAAITWEELLELEQRANRYLCENHPVEIGFYSGADLDRLTYRSKKALEGEVRIVTFPGADRCACCGTHVSRSGEIGVLKFLSCIRFREGVRIELLCGERAYRYLSAACEQNLTVARSLSAKPLQSAAAVERLLAELGDTKQRAARSEAQLFERVASEYEDAGNVLLFAEELPPASVQRLCDAVASRCKGRCAVFAGTGGSWRYAMAQRSDGDLRALTSEMNAALHGRGGGKPLFVQGSAACTRREIEMFFSGLTGGSTIAELTQRHN